jgi:hypothetical protein
MLRPQNGARLNPVIVGLPAITSSLLTTQIARKRIPKSGGNRANLLIITFEVNQNTT